MPKQIAFVGDICLAGRPSEPAYFARRHLADNIWDTLGEKACLVGTIEAPFSSRGSPKPHKACLRANPEAARMLAGFDVGLLGNNHIEDFGAEAAFDTRLSLREHGCQSVGYGENLSEAIAPVFVDLEGVRAAILSFCCLTTRADGFATDRASGVAPLSLGLVRDAIKMARNQADLVILCPHWGVQGALLPTIEDLLLARAAIEFGANAVVGTHAHVVQSVETYLGSPIIYGLGNYLFDDLDVAYTDHMGRLTGERYKVTQSEVNRTSLLVSLRPVYRESGWSLEIASRWEARQDTDLCITHRKIEGLTRTDRLLAAQLSVLPLDLSSRTEAVYSSSCNGGIITYCHRVPPLSELTFVRAAFLRLFGALKNFRRKFRRL